jgi:drug/metabolite transporter (DMT)-like permease
MSTLLLAILGIAVAFATARFVWHEEWTTTELWIGIFAGVAGAGLTQVLTNAGGRSSYVLPFMLTCGVALALESVRQSALLNAEEERSADAQTL